MASLSIFHLRVIFSRKDSDFIGNTKVWHIFSLFSLFLFLGFSAAGSRKSQVSRLLNLGKESTKRKKQSHLCNCFFSVGAEETSIVRNLLQPNIFYKSCFPSPTIAPNFFIGTSYGPCAGAKIIPGFLREYKVKPSVSGKISTPHSSGSISPENLASLIPALWLHLETGTYRSDRKTHIKMSEVEILERRNKHPKLPNPHNDS